MENEELIEETTFKIIRLKNWFTNYYTIHEQQYRRLHTLGDTSAYGKLINLYNQAEQYRAEIQKLEEDLAKLRTNS